MTPKPYHLFYDKYILKIGRESINGLTVEHPQNLCCCHLYHVQDGMGDIYITHALEAGIETKRDV